MKQTEFRAELIKIMPGYTWTVHASRCSEKMLVATGIQTSGLNRLSTLRVERRDNYASSGKPRYEVKSAGFGTRAPWLHTTADQTLARALRGLQDHYEREANKYRGHANDLAKGRSDPTAEPVAQAGQVPAGWRMVPIEPLLNMMSDKDHDTRIMAERQLLAMLAAAPAQGGE